MHPFWEEVVKKQACFLHLLFSYLPLEARDPETYQMAEPQVEGAWAPESPQESCPPNMHTGLLHEQEINFCHLKLPV